MHEILKYIHTVLGYIRTIFRYMCKILKYIICLAIFALLIYLFVIPSHNVPTSSHANYEINGVHLRIPREDLYEMHHEKDGPQSFIGLRFVYPEMRPVLYEQDKERYIDECGAEVNNENLIRFTINATGPNLACSEEGDCGGKSCKTGVICGDPALYMYREFNFWYNDDRKQTCKPELNLMQKNVFGSDLYQNTIFDTDIGKRVGMFHNYIIGKDKWNPEYWVSCPAFWDWQDGKKCYRHHIASVCRTYFNMFDKKVYVDYIFYKDAILPYHLDLRQKIIDKINSYVVKE